MGVNNNWNHKWRLVQPSYNLDKQPEPGDITWYNFYMIYNGDLSRKNKNG